MRSEAKVQQPRNVASKDKRCSLSTFAYQFHHLPGEPGTAIGGVRAEQTAFRQFMDSDFCGHGGKHGGQVQISIGVLSCEADDIHPV